MGTCFWDTIIRHVRAEDLTSITKSGKNTPLSVALGLQRINTENVSMDHVMWQGKRLTSKEIEEMKEWIRTDTHTEKSLKVGHYTSVCDPYLCLLCAKFNINIIHNYCGNRIIYSVQNHRYKIEVRSDRGHIQ